MHIHITPSTHAPETLFAIETHAQNLWQLTNTEQTDGALIISFGNEVEAEADLHITVINESQIQLGIKPYLAKEPVYSTDMSDPQHLLHWVNLSRWLADDTDLLTHFLTMLIGLINCPGQIDTRNSDWSDVRYALQLGTEAIYMSMQDESNFKPNYRPNLVSTLMLMNTEGNINQKFKDAERYLTSQHDTNQVLTILNLTHQTCIPRINTAIFISDVFKQVLH